MREFGVGGSLLGAAVLLLVVVGAAVVEEGEIRDFFAVNVLQDGEVETRVLFGGVAGKETALAGGSSSSFKLRQIADLQDGFLQLVYDEEGVLTDCEVVRQRAQARKFLSAFRDDLRDLIAASNLTVTSLDHGELPQSLGWLDYPEMRRQCRLRHRQLREEANQRLLSPANLTDLTGLSGSHRFFLFFFSSLPNTRRSPRDIFRVPGTLWCGPSNSAATYTKLGLMADTDRCCRRHDHCKRGIPRFSTKYNFHNYRPFTISHCFCDARHKRDVSDLLRIPGTKWCGKGYSADKYTRLGGFSRTDKCCRRHDMSCPFWIGGFQTKYGLFNWRVNTLMHCSCDERFRGCLKMVGSSDANLVGKIFFNVVQSKCFVLKPRKRCTKMSWWGKCEKVKYEKQAILRDNLPY